MITASLPIAFVLLMNKTPMELFHAGGPIMWPILIISFLGITVVVERLLFIIRENSSREPEVVEKMLERVEQRDFEGAIQLGKKSKDFVARILTYALTHRESSLSNAFIRASNQELNRFNQGMATLDTVITAAPLLGLLGTVTGMMRTFGNMTGDLAAAASGITGGVAEALIATACGLAIAVTALLPYNYLTARAEEARHEVADVSNALELILKKAEGAIS
ncbi:MAG TPA: MotA/TolQ/ExbB proton channel family protein [Opitutaceae bacterium]|nr:MotA/TolQ/ExbB proton channel family protein [Opitutaceae bacterium]